MSKGPLAAERERRRREREEHRQRPPHSNRRRLLTGGLLTVAALGLAAIAALAYRHFHRSTPPPVVLKTVTVTIPEGYTRSETASLAREDGLTGSYMAASRGHEGFLFPDTFELDRHAAAAELVQRQLEDFKQRIRGVDLAYARSKNLTLRDVVTIASMIEHEAATERDRPLVAAVIYNRLHEGMPLGIDATIRFATGNYTQPLTESELAVESPYNTRTHTGLPPGPIDSPGLASIEAAAHPAKVDYLFYVTKPGTCGGLAFAATEAEFEEDAALYDSAREAAGGNSPDTCGE
jgi:cell division protein YceG involved in septum cleavage